MTSNAFSKAAMEIIDLKNACLKFEAPAHLTKFPLQHPVLFNNETSKFVCFYRICNNENLILQYIVKRIGSYCRAEREKNCDIHFWKFSVFFRRKKAMNE